MKKERNWYENYPGCPKATNLSMAGGAARILAILMGVGAALTLVLLLAVGLGLMSGGRGGLPLLWLLDEMDDEVGMLLALMVGAVLCAIASGMLRGRARDMAVEGRPASEAKE